jgi:hypothetical protein
MFSGCTLKTEEQNIISWAKDTWDDKNCEFLLWGVKGNQVTDGWVDYLKTAD